MNISNIIIAYNEARQVIIGTDGTVYAYAYGGAFCTNSITLNIHSNVHFIGNSVYAQSSGGKYNYSYTYGGAIYADRSFSRHSATSIEQTAVTPLTFSGSYVEFKNHTTAPIYSYAFMSHINNTFTQADIVAISIYMPVPPTVTGSASCKIMGEVKKVKNYGINAKAIVNLYGDGAGSSLINRINSADYTFTTSSYSATKCLW